VADLNVAVGAIRQDPVALHVSRRNTNNLGCVHRGFWLSRGTWRQCVRNQRVALANERIGEEAESNQRQNTRNTARLGDGMQLCLVTSLSGDSCTGSRPPEFLAASVQSNGTFTQTLLPLPTLTFQDALDGPRELIHSFNPRLAMPNSLTKSASSRAEHLFQRSISHRNTSTHGNGLITLIRTDYKRTTVAEAISRTNAEKGSLLLRKPSLRAVEAPPDS
jgi:hypothetical protein